MGAFDTSIAPRALTPANTSETTLITIGTDTTSGQDAQLTMEVSVITGDTPTVRVGIIPSGGSVHWKLYDDTVQPGNPLIGLGPWFFQSGDVVRVRTSIANAVTFSVTGTRSS
jgi:hypothetical protein